MSIALHLISIFLVIGTFLPMWRCDWWVVRGWDFPRLQLFVAVLLCLSGRAIIGMQDVFPDGLVSLLLVCAAIHLFMLIWPYQPLARKDVPDGTGDSGVRLLISNVLMDNRDSQKLVGLVRAQNPDILVALETDKWWVDMLLALKDQLPHSVELPQPDTYGLLLMSKFPLQDIKVKYLVRENIPSVHGKIRLDDASPIRFHALHPKPPFPDEDTTSKDRDVELMIVAEEVRETGGATIVFGDLNDVAWSHTTRLFRRVSGMHDLRIGRGLFSTFHAGHWWMRWPLDHVFVSDEFCVREIRRLPAIGSDHFPILADLSYEPDRERMKDEP